MLDLPTSYLCFCGEYFNGDPNDPEDTSCEKCVKDWNEISQPSQKDNHVIAFYIREGIYPF